jgi:hypothetical protein
MYFNVIAQDCKFQNYSSSFLSSRKRTLLSLAKLHLVTEEKLGPDPEVVQAELENVEAELALLTHQEQLPVVVLQAYDIDPNTMRVFTASELMEVCHHQSKKFFKKKCFSTFISLCFLDVHLRRECFSQRTGL